MEETRKLLDAYYQAINSKDTGKIKTFLNANVKVTFPDSNRNWSGSELVDKNFGSMWSIFPNFKVEEYTLARVTEIDGDVDVDVEIEATFADREKNYLARKYMKYEICN